MAVWWLFLVPVVVVVFPLTLFTCLSRKSRRGTHDIAGKAGDASPNNGVKLKNIQQRGSHYGGSFATDEGVEAVPLDELSHGNGHSDHGTNGHTNGHNDSVITVDHNEEEPPSPLSVFKFPASPRESTVVPASFNYEDGENGGGLDTTASYREPAAMGQKSLTTTTDVNGNINDGPLLVDEEGFSIIPEESTNRAPATKRDSFYSSDEEDEEADRGKWSRLTIKSTAEASTVATQDEIDQQVSSLSSTFQLADTTPSNRRSRAATMYATPTQGAPSDSFAAFDMSFNGSTTADLVDDPFATPSHPSTSSNKQSHSQGQGLVAADDVFANDAFASTPATTNQPSSQHLEAVPDPFASAALSPVSADSPTLSSRQRSATVPASIHASKEPSLDTIAFQKVPLCHDTALVDLVKTALREERIKLWLPPHSDPVGNSTLEMEVVERVANKIGRGVEVTGKAMEHLRAATYNKKLRMIKTEQTS
eukprot:TRINITY_DN8398_c0_g1_i5.p1 TRINITY_DN8398_c0_g1~~TRINITY_DN8398_c0_g1_i5.p1  ORF type:complete len:479 (+),score=120.97 TRINITY_DN8398_c0_g1_i5:236-1672(+)